MRSIDDQKLPAVPSGRRALLHHERYRSDIERVLPAIRMPA